MIRANMTERWIDARDLMDKNEAARFLGEGMTFKAKLIGILEVNEARGDKMCQDALNDLKTAIRAAGEHKQRITISIAIDGLRLRDEKTGDCLYHHPVHKISFIAQDMSDSRAFGYIFGSPDTGHRFFGIKTDKTASQVVISMRDLFQVVFELKKKEIEMAKHHIEQRQIRYGTTVTADTSHHLKNDYETEKVKGKHQQMIKIRYITSKPVEPSAPTHKPSASEAIADLLDLEHELNSIQQGINQMDRITPSDPFGPLARPDPFPDIFEDPFASKLETVPEMKPPLQMAPPPPCTKSRAVSQSESPTELEKQSNIFDGASCLPTKTTYVPQFPPAPKTEEPHWFDQETESLFNEATNVSSTEPTSSPMIFPTQEKYETEQGPQEKSPLKPDVFMELDPLGSGWVKPYVDKKDFFQDLKNPQKKVLKELLPDYSNDNSQGYLVQMEPAKAGEAAAVQEQSPVRSVLPSAPPDTLFQAPKESTNGAKYSKLDPFDDTDPFEKTDPFADKNYPTEIPPLFNEKSFEGVFPEASAFENVTKEEDTPFTSSSIHGPLRVSLPPEKSDTNTPISLSSITSKFRNSPSPPDIIRRKNYQAFRHYMDERIEETLKSPPGDEDFYYTTIPAMPIVYSPKTLGRKTYSSKKYWGDGFGKAPSPPPKPALFSIKPPPLPPKKQPQSKPPARPPSLEDRHIQYDTLKDDFSRIKEPKSSGKKYKRLVTKPKIPLLPPPPQRKMQPEKSAEEKPPAEQKSSILGITLYQLDNTGLENLAMTLGIPSENIYNMTLQELTTRLSAKNLTAEAKQPETFQADFESNFAKPEVSRPPAEYDKYAAIKELIENENKTENGDAIVKKETEAAEKPNFIEDRYAALRQLSLNPQKSENLSEDLDISVEEDSGNRAENLSDGARALALDSFTPGNSLELAAESPITVDKEEKDVEEAAGIENGAAAKIESVEKPSDIPFPENVREEPRDNWAAFEKISLYDAPPQADNFNDNDNSPYSSDGKEDSFEWRKKTRQRTRSELPWRDEDESWDDYSPKESYWSEESSHDERSHDKRRDEKYQRKACGKQMRKGKGDQWFRRSKWNEETEDEYEEWYKNHRHRGGACGKERKNEACLLDDWYDSRNKSYDDSERYMRWSRKKSESDDEYRRRCDSDTSDREYIWTCSKRNFPEGYSSGEKKQYYMMPRDYPERYHESRSRHRKGESHKRPSSASEGKRNYDKMSEHMARGKRGSTESEQAASYHKDFRYCCPESVHHYNSYDRRVAQGRKSSRTRRGDLEQCGMETKEKKLDTYDYYKSLWHKEDGRRSRRYHFEDDFTPTTPDKAQPRLHSPKRESSKSPRRRHRQRGGRDGFFRPDNNDEGFENVGEDFRPAGTYNPQDEAEKDQASKQQIFGKNHFGPLTRQESSASLRKSESINIFSRENDPFEGDDFFSSTPPPGHKLNRFKTEKSKSNSNVSETFSWKGVFGDPSFHG